tara:strand:+ start:3166 stop:3609 length:444 start_codon:yes stop_codon:yes gene_type:complete
MTISKTLLKRIIKEELKKSLYEAQMPDTVSVDPQDCPEGQSFGSLTGKPCADWLAGNSPQAKKYIEKYGDPGCTPGAGFSPVTGEPCKSGQPAAGTGKKDIQSTKAKKMQLKLQKMLQKPNIKNNPEAVKTIKSQMSKLQSYLLDIK